VITGAHGGSLTDPGERLLGSFYTDARCLTSFWGDVIMGFDHRVGHFRPLRIMGVAQTSRVIASNFTIGMKSMGCHIWSILDLFSNHLINFTL
jgi:hypothetical protein